MLLDRHRVRHHFFNLVENVEKTFFCRAYNLFGLLALLDAVEGLINRLARSGRFPFEIGFVVFLFNRNTRLLQEVSDCLKCVRFWFWFVLFIFFRVAPEIFFVI
jgi:hypothetical protein